MGAEENRGGSRPRLDELVTKEDLEHFRSLLVQEIKYLLKENTHPTLKKWMKSREVMKLLEISAGTLQTLRNSKVISFMKIGGAIYYDREDIHNMFEQHKTNKK
ncbi:helix-turn-helix domain-containing protein [Pedobacter sp. B4-66]|uniref:helix-turn-helix domain-containing protein n=1 Tax=Pedobacter sp. B4-66 TaxID=2817280 RepID=UPI001BD94B59|nr:helix-turn-helix domain-containing protein [Pedobacter sp. B4-66]